MIRFVFVAKCSKYINIMNLTFVGELLGYFDGLEVGDDVGLFEGEDVGFFE